MIDAQFISKSLRGRKSGSGFVARCPAHDDRNASLSICDGRDGKVLVKCHTGCSQASVITALKDRNLWPGGERRPFMRRTWKPKPHPQKTVVSAQQRSDFAMELWHASLEASSSPVTTYAASRGITDRLPTTLRYHPALKHPSGQLFPAMIGLVTFGADDTPIGIHRTYLAQDGSGKANVAQTKLMLGPCSGGAVRLQEATEVVMIGEGIETCLSAMQATGIPAWAALSTSGMRSLVLPDTVREVIILVDADEAGESAAIACASRWKQESRRVKLARPPKGSDFNDMLIDDLRQSGGGHND